MDQLQTPPKWSSTKMIIHQNDRNLEPGESWKVFWWFQVCSVNYFFVLYCAKTIFMKTKTKIDEKTHYFFCETLDCVFCTLFCYKNRYRARFAKVFRMRSTLFFEFERLLCLQLQTPPKWSPTKMIFSGRFFLKLTKMIFHFSGKLL